MFLYMYTATQAAAFLQISAAKAAPYQREQYAWGTLKGT